MKHSSKHPLKNWWSGRQVSAGLRDDSGSAAIEFVLSFPIVVLATLIVFDVGGVVQESSTLSAAAREAVRFGSARASNSVIPATTAEIEAVANDILLNYTDYVVTVIITPPAYYDASIHPDPFLSGGVLTVEITRNHDFLLGGFIGAAPVELSGRADMLII